MTRVASETKLGSVVRSSMHPSPGNCVAIGRSIVYHARAAHAFSAGIKCRHFMNTECTMYAFQVIKQVNG